MRYTRVLSASGLTLQRSALFETRINQRLFSVSRIHQEDINKDQEVEAAKQNHDEFTRKAEEEKAKEKRDQKEADMDETVREKILSASLQFVPTYGWSRESIEAGAESLGYPPVTGGVIKSADIELTHHLYKTSNQNLVKEMKREISEFQEQPVKVGPFVRRNTEKRLRMNIPYLVKWPEALAIMSYPKNAPQSLHYGLELVDSIWHHAGCKSTDINWYTKRLSLLAIFKSTELAMMQDKSPDFKETWQFLDRRLEDHQSLANVFVSPDDAGKILNAIGTTFQSVLGLKR